MDADGKAVADDIVQQTGDDGATLLSNADSDTLRILADGSGDLDQSFRRAVARAADGDSIDSYAQLDRAVRTVDSLDATKQRRAKQLIAETDGAGVKLIDELGDSNQQALEAFLEADLPTADMSRWRNALARRVAADSAIRSQDVQQYAQDIRDIQRLMDDDSVTINKPNRVVQETIDNPTDDGQILGQMLEAKRTSHYANKHGDVTVDPKTPGDGEPDLRVGRGSDADLYVETKMVEGDLEGGLKVKDKIVEADGSFNGITGAHDEVIEISAQREIPDDFNSPTPDPETPRESFKGLVKANRDPTEPNIEGLPEKASTFDNPDMVIRIVEGDGNIVDGGEFAIKKVYQEVNNGN